MPIIKTLSQEIANMIAAGEVVERPASVVKELIENSIDANSKNIIIKITDAGRKLIRVSDDGDGMDKEDLTLAFLPHSTSKISTQRDLFRISTLGFRGEALPSIASVSEVTVRSTHKDSKEGNFIKIVSSKIVESGKSSPIKGTTIDVENLFFNTPARLKYLKSFYVEVAKISDVVSKLAMSHLDISFSLYYDDKLSFYTSGKGNILEVLTSLYGLEVAREMKHFKTESEDFVIEGYTSAIGVSKSNKNFITTILNSRPVRMNQVINSIIKAYDTYLFDNRYPISLINITVDPNLVDVNVHPSKQEVRISKEKELNELIEKAIKDMFSNNFIAPQFYVEKEKTSEVKIQQSIEISKLEDFNSFDNFIFEKPSNNIQTEFVYKEDSNDNTSKKEDITPIGQFIGKYVLAHNQDSLFIIDQHAAAERINYEKFQRKFNDMTTWTFTDLLVPFVISLNPKDSILLQEHFNFLKQLGFNVEVFGNNTFKISALPTWMKESETEKYLEEILNYVISNGGKLKTEDIRKEVIATISCKASLKANKFLSYNDMFSLINNLFKCDNPYTCPHGRPTMIIHSLTELDRMFKRT